MIFHLRPVSEQDLQQIKHINDLVQSIPWSLNEILSEFDQNNPYSLCATGGDGKILGYLFIRNVGSDLEITTLCVAPSAQRQGVAKGLLKEIIKTKPPGAGILLEVSEKNAPAVSLYKALGFQIQGIRQHYYRDDSNALLMKLDLAKPQ